MAIVCPTVLATDKHDFREQLLRVEPFATRIQIDLTDGYFAPVKTVALTDVHWPKHIKADLHLMFGKPVLSIREIVNLRPHLVIVHAEASGNFVNFAKVLHKFNIKVGVAVLPGTSIDEITPALSFLDHLLIFSGDLGHFGGTADLDLLAKAQAAKELKPSLEVGWDGGVNDQNAHLLVAGGVDVLNVGGFIQKASNPEAAYAKIKAQL
jgi:ribulose-phosphate 3-epimerase